MTEKKSIKPENFAPKNTFSQRETSDVEDGKDVAESKAKDMEELRDKNNELTLALEENKKQLMYVLAECENIRRRSANDVESAKSYAITNFATDMLQVLENLDRALETVTPEMMQDQHNASLHTGVTMTKKEIVNIFSRYGISKISAEKGVKFDHRFHHAVKSVASPDQESNSIVEVLQDGYMLKDRVLRASMVVISTSE